MSAAVLAIRRALRDLEATSRKSSAAETGMRRRIERQGLDGVTDETITEALRWMLRRGEVGHAAGRWWLTRRTER